MIRIGCIIVAMAAIGAAAVHLRVQQERVRSDCYRLEAERLELRRTLWQQQLRLGELTAPEHIRRIHEDWPVELVGPGESPAQAPWLAQRPVGQTP